jgi:hypothetical protein
VGKKYFSSPVVHNPQNSGAGHPWVVTVWVERSVGEQWASDRPLVKRAVSLFVQLIIRTFQLVFSTETMFFSHNKSVFFTGLSAQPNDSNKRHGILDKSLRLPTKNQPGAVPRRCFLVSVVVFLPVSVPSVSVWTVSPSATGLADHGPTRAPSPSPALALKLHWVRFRYWILAPMVRLPVNPGSDALFFISFHFQLPPMLPYANTKVFYHMCTCVRIFKAFSKGFS